MRFITIVLFLHITILTVAQQGTIKGIVADSETKTPIEGATVLTGTNQADNTDAYGGFMITGLQPGNYELVASHIGYRTEILPVEVKENLVTTLLVNLKTSRPSLSEVRLNSRKSFGGNILGQVDIILRPVNNSQDILRIVPGIFIAQHAGGGKAEQIFLRGFDIDHGTDIQLSADGMPVNMVSHAHGQGYADLHFIIPETIEKINFDFGPYNTEKGNLATAGFVDFESKDFLKENLVKLEVAEFNTRRVVGLAKLFNRETHESRQQVYLASEYFASDNYFESPQNFHRFNLLAKYSAWFGNQTQLTISASAFDSKWDASGQIPERAVKSGMIGRFGYIDNTEGGNTGRYNVNFKLSTLGKTNWKTTNQLYFSKYIFNLYSNFTFFLSDPVNGDQINQEENRNIFGYTGSTQKTWLIGNRKAVTQFGAGFRIDHINDIALSHTVKRTFLHAMQSGDIREGNEWVYADQHIDLSHKFSLQAGLRFDHFDFAYRNKLLGEREFTRRSGNVLSPKLNLAFSPSSKVKLSVNNGIGFHSNDSRVILDNTAREVLPKTFGTDLGIMLKPSKDIVVKTTFWHLYSQQEFVYVGDAGIVEPGGATRRLGTEISARYQVNKWLFADVDVNLTIARSLDVPKGEDQVPLAAAFTSIGGLTARTGNGFSGSVRYRYLGDRPANERNTVTASGYFLADVVLHYSWKKLIFSATLENIFNTEWNEAQFDTESRLFDEPAPVSEIHYTPGRPRYFKVEVSLRF